MCPMRRWHLVGGLFTTLLIVCPTGALAKGAMPEPPAQAQAVLDGRLIPLVDVVNHHCHDLDVAVYRCFDTEAERDADALTLLGDGLLGPLGSTSLSYALAYSAINYGGSSLLISSSIANLGTIGWNDVISSFKSTNGGRPKWWAAANYSGASWQWVASAWVPYVGDDANDRFSSVKNVP